MRGLMWALFFSWLPLSSSLALDENDKLLADCLKATVADPCEVATARLASQHRIKEALAASEHGCELDSASCSQSYYLAARLGTWSADDIFKKMIIRCERKTLACATMASIYLVRGDLPSAIKVAKKYEEKFGGDQSHWLHYLNGDKKQAFEGSLKSCRAENEHCVFYLRYMPDHPQRNEILKLSEASCKNSAIWSSGASSCAITGAHYSKKLNHEKAYEMWASDSGQNMSSSLMIIGSEKYDIEKTNLAFRQFCENKSKFIEGSQWRLQYEYCKDKKTVQKIPSEVLEEARELLAKYFEEQK